MNKKENYTSISAFKKHDEKALVGCELNDLDAVLFQVSHPGMCYSGDTLDYDTLDKAEAMSRVIERNIDMGKRYAKQELNKWLNPPTPNWRIG